MHQVKLFKSIESELWTMEAEINEWLPATNAKVISVTGNIAPQTADSSGIQGSFSASDVLVVIVYEAAGK
ncbi:MAG: hypothetical protein KDA47_09335 [Planctomycetales bacterium]|nr:hypothetical protein [Planctomycetales bacterium]